MNKKEIIWREILHQAIKNKRVKWTQKELAQKFGFSLSTVFNALKAPRKSGAVKVGGRGFEVRDIEKFLYLWATFRNLKGDIVYKTNVPKNVSDIEGEMPPGIIFGAFSAFYKKHKEAPADYDKVYIYAYLEDLKKIKDRFPKRKGYQNLIVLRADPWLKDFGEITPDVQTFVDLWNLPDWYAKDFLKDLEKKMFK